MQHEDYMSLALEEARLAAQEGEVPVGAVMVHNGHILCRAHNTREHSKDPTAHAEILCMRRAAELLGTWHLTGCTLYVTLEPCPMCAGAMVMSQLDMCVFGACDEKLGCCGSIYDLPGDKALGGRTRWQAGVMQAECGKVLQDFFKAKR
ncbi:MAG: nucleoside deaminase [Clostridia bacterium]|nr:nucleoside deaminase [Clostridia bacterium]